MATTIIVGAGASVDYNFPTGPSLQKEICSLVRSKTSEDYDLNPEIMGALSEFHKRGANYGKVFELCQWMANTLPLANSIDSFLEAQSHGDDAIAYLGKLAICSIIATRERQSSLFVKDETSLDFSNLSKTWLGKLWAKTNKGGAARISEKGLGDLKFITFNYDRCIEQFLFLAFKNFYRISDSEAHNFVNMVQIEHVYGSLGKISNHASQFGFGNFDRQYAIYPTIDRIKTYSEQVESETSDRIGNILLNSERIIFLGFSFSTMNTNFLSSIYNNDDSLQKIYGTSYGMSASDNFRAQNWCDNTFRRGNIGATLENIKCPDFFDQNYLLF